MLSEVGSEPVVQFEGIGLTYPGVTPVAALRDCNLTVKRGEYLSVVGPSGSGKSTFLNIVGLLDRPTAGRYLLDGLDTADLKDSERTALRGRRLGFVFQAFHLLPYRTALENVILSNLYQGKADRKLRRQRAQESLERVGIGHRSHALPTELSGGERQRVAIARALVSDPALLLCDEPTGNLDSVTTTSVLNLLDGLHAEGVTILTITHDPMVAERAEGKLVMADGYLAPVAESRSRRRR